jgi:prepilin-type N-terminal cleavage/methylation domain-containing protein
VRRGFTLIEVMAVMAIIAVMIFAIVPNLDNQVPVYRLKAAAREVASNIELAQSEAIAKRKRHIVRYDIERRSYTILLPPVEDPDADSETDPLADPFGGEEKMGRPRDDMEHGTPPPDPDATDDMEEEEEEVDPDDLEALPETFLPDDIIFVRIEPASGSPATGGRIDIPFTHQGNDGAHTVGLAVGSERELTMYVKFNPMTRSLEFSESEPEIRTLEGDSE